MKSSRFLSAIGFPAMKDGYRLELLDGSATVRWRARRKFTSLVKSALLSRGRRKRNCNSSFALIGRGSKGLPYDSPEYIVDWQTSREVPGSN
jgi:hypothetical protein